MSRDNFPIIALLLALPLLAALFFGGQPGAHGAGTLLPLLTLLAISELGAITNIIGAALGVRRLVGAGATAGRVLVIVGCAIAAAVFLWQLARFWPL